MTISRLSRPEGLPPVNGYSHVTRATGEIIHVSGQTPVDAEGRISDVSDAAAQTRQVFINLEIALRAVGATWKDVVKVTYYLTDLADLPAVRFVRDEILGTADLPASSLVQVAGLVHPDFRVEIDVVAVIAGS